MKNLNPYLIITLLYCTINLSQAQYVPFPKGKAVWRNFERMSWFMPERLAIWYYQPGTDTLINNATYKKIYKVSKADATATNDTVYTTAIREDEAKQKVWIIPANTTEEKLLFDFDLKLGDKIMGWYNIDKPLNPDSYFEVVTVTDGFAYKQGAIQRRRFGLEGYDSNNNLFSSGSLIAGIGFGSGFLNNPSTNLNHGYYRELCFSDDVKDIRMECYKEAENPKSVFAADRQEQTLSIYPNPVQDILHVQSVDACSKLMLRNSSGAVVKEQQLANKIDVSALPIGLYLLELIDNDGKRVVQKFEKK